MHIGEAFPGRSLAKIIVIVERLKDWNSFYPVEQLMTPRDYLVNWNDHHHPGRGQKERIKIINLCRSYKYLSSGYYCSLLAEARGHSVIPSVSAISELSKSTPYNLGNEELDVAIQKAFRTQPPSDNITVTIYFGRTEKYLLEEVARQIFDLFTAPILKVEFKWDKKWMIHSLRAGSLTTLSESEEDKFASSLDEYSGKIWKRPKTKKKYRYDLAILYNPQEEFAPSNKKALQNFTQAGKEHDVLVELIEKKDFARIAEYDALFIRETTSITNHTYRFAKKAESEGLVCIDDSISILRCTNKIYLHNLLHSNHIRSPKTVVFGRGPEQLRQVIQKIGLPMIIKIPDGSFSQGVYKVQTKDELESVTLGLFKRTSLLLAQEYFYTDFDWRIGILNDRPLFACKYYMTKGHWQIYDHSKRERNGVRSGESETFPLSKVPRNVLSTALKLSHQVGNSLYGVDLKEKDGKAYVIEINDNPNIDANVEDAIAGGDLYQNMIREFVRRIEEKK